MRSKVGIRTLTWLLVLLLVTPTGLGAQGQGAGTAEKYIYTQEQLDQLLAPIALYPDVLLSQILMASTYPLEVVEANRWLKQNPNLADTRLDEVLKDKPWDVSVKSLCHFPQVLSMMDEKLQQTTDLGDAFLGQQDQVMDTIQRLRSQAQAQGNLTSTEQQRVIVEDRDIIIEPAYPDVIYVPAYDPCWAYGPWWYPTCFPPWFWYPGFVVGRGFFWGPRIFVGPIGFWCGFSWRRHSIFIDVNRTVFINRVGASRMHGGVEVWQHDPGHRRGVSYHDNTVARRFGFSGGGPGVEARRPFRGFTPQESGTVQVRPLTRPEMRPESLSGGIERQGVQPREAPSGSRGFEFPRSGPTGQIPGQSRSGGAFEGFGRSGIESQQQSERGHQSLGVGPQGGFAPRAISPSPGGFSAPSNRGFSEGTRPSGGAPQSGGAHDSGRGGGGSVGGRGGEHRGR